MAGALQLPLSEVWQYTLRQLVLCYESWMLHQWDLNSNLAYRLENVQKSFSADKNTKPSTLTGVHPFRKTNKLQLQGPNAVQIRGDDMESFKQVAVHLFGKRH